ncbi:MAG: DEAD/DEAH box helicase [Clostridia bacterium]|nr:DEAD/DEAH box helicase [Clostridia bacterium]
MSIPRGFIRKLADNDQVYSRGLSLHATPFSYQIEPLRFTELYSVSADFSQDKCRSFVEIDNAHEWFENFSCSCDYFTEKGTICEHLVALLLKIENDFFSVDFGRTDSRKFTLQTDDSCRELLSERTSLLQARAKQRAMFEKATLSPQIHIKKGCFELGLKIGVGRGYIVRDLEELYQLFLYGKTAPCGQAKSFLYAPENFQNEEFVRFFIAYYPLCRSEENSKTMRLTPEAIDAFFYVFSQGKITTSSGILSITDTLPTLSVWIKQAKGFYRLSLSRRDFEVIRGQKQCYIIMDGNLHVCHEAFTDACSGLLYGFIQNKADLIVADSDMPSFYTLVLRPASKFIHTESEDDSFIPPALKTKIYLDMVDKIISARTQFFYDEQMYYAFSQERDFKTVWDIEEETLIENMVKDYFPKLSKEKGTALLEADDESLYTLLSEGIPRLSRHAVLYISSSLKDVRMHSFSMPRIGLRVKSNLLEMDVSSDVFSPSVLAEALSAYRQKKKYIRLKNGSFLTLTNDAIHRFSHMADGVDISSSDLKKTTFTLPAYRALYLDAVSDIRIVKENSFTNLMEVFNNLQHDKMQIPSGFRNVLRDYQKYGLRWMHALSSCGFGGILADDMGLGKTIQVLSLLTLHKETHGSCFALVVCPASLVLNWEQEARRFAQNLKTLCIMGSNAERQAILSKSKDYDVLITSYDLLKRDIESYRALEFDYEIIDEAQYIKNHSTKNARAVKAIASRCRFALTGTPIENTISELWSIFDYLMPGYLYKYSRFRTRFEIPILRDEDSIALSELKKMVSPFILRRLKRDVLTELPEKNESVLYVNMAPEQHKLYAANLATMQKDLDLELSGYTSQNKLVILAMLMRLRQLCCDPAILYENYKEDSAKLDLCMNLVETSVAAGHKILIFSQFTSMLSRIALKLKKRHLSYYLIEGATKKEDRLAQVNAFNQDETPVFLVSLKAGGTGLNLTGADVVIHYDPWWNQSVQNQATDRSHRIGQKKSVSVYKLIAKDTIEEKIMALANKKQSLAEAVLPDDQNIFKNLTKEELLDLFRL